MKFSFINLGCKINQIEMEQASQSLVSLGYQFTNEIKKSDFILINTCTVTAKADKKSFQAIKKYSRQEKLKHIFVTGCYSELETELAAKVHPKNFIVAQKDKHRMPEIIHSLLKKEYGNIILPPSHIPAKDKFSAFKLAKISSKSMGNKQVKFFKHIRAFLKIQDGCNAFCSYCRIPYARGAPVSRSYVNILKHVNHLRLAGTKEIVLSGINIGKYYDAKAKVGFSLLLRDILHCLEGYDIRVKISSLEPFSLDEDFFSCISHPNIAPHIHLPLQGLSDEILHRMNRRYCLIDFQRIVNRIYDIRPDFSIATDVIVGYPGETEEIYEQGKKFLWKCGISKIHVFPFSSRPFTKDSSIQENKDDLPVKVKKYRSQDLRNFSEKIENRFIKNVANREQKMILENPIRRESKVQEKELSKKVLTVGRDKLWYSGTTEYNLKGIVSIENQLKIGKKQLSSDRYRGLCVTVKLLNSQPLIFQALI